MTKENLRQNMIIVPKPKGISKTKIPSDEELLKALKAAEEKREEEERETYLRKVPRELEDFRLTMGYYIEKIYDDWDSRQLLKKMIDAMERISSESSFRVVREKDGTRRIEFELKWKFYTLLDVNVGNIASERSCSLASHRFGVKKQISLENNYNPYDNGGGDKGIKDYVEKKYGEWFVIPRKDDIKLLWEALREELGTTETELDGRVMLMYLTGMYWDYWLSDVGENKRSIVRFEKPLTDRYGSCFDTWNMAGLMMLACKDKNKEEVLDDLKENHIQIEEDKEMFGYKWKIVHLDLPAVGDFKWFKFDYFVSNNKVYYENLKKENKIMEQSHSLKDVIELFENMREYMKACWVFMDREMDFEKDVEWDAYRYLWQRRFDTWDCLKDLLQWNDKPYRMKNRSSDNFDICSFEEKSLLFPNLFPIEDGYHSYLFLRV